MNVLLRIWNSSVGKKYIMALSGLALVLFVIGHMVGNLQIFLGPDAINRYAHFLQSNVELLWPVRIVMLILVCLHLICAIRLYFENKAARPVEYAHGKAPFMASLASRTMILGGLVVACFVVFHLLHYTVKIEALSTIQPDGAKVSVRYQDLKEVLPNGEIRPDVYSMMVAGFSNTFISLFYLVSVGLLCFHLSHGISAMFQSLGFRTQNYIRLVEKAATVIALVLCLGYFSIPIAVLAGKLGQEHLSKSVAAAAAAKASEVTAPPAKN